ncbi:MAG: META domain-containing protein [Gaiellaceae bacterium]
MRGKARFWLLPVLAAAVLAGACGGDDDGPPLEGTEWALASGVDMPGDADPPTLLLEEGNASGFGGCNTFTGAYELDGDSISIGPLAGTLMACELQKMAVEGAYMPALEAADAWSIDGDELVLSSGGEATLRFSSA